MLANDQLLSKGKYQKRFLSNINIASPQEVIGKFVPQNLIFEDRCLPWLGSILITDKKLECLRKTTDPQLPVLNSYNQVFTLPSANASNYYLNYTSHHFINEEFLHSGRGGYGSWITGQYKLYQSKQLDKKFALDMAAGVFKTGITVLFDECKTAPQVKHAPLLLATWSAYANNRIKEGDSIIKSFEGIVLHSHEGAVAQDKLTFEATIKAQIAVPFFNSDLALNTDIGIEKNLKSENNRFSVYMYHEPEFLTIPSPRFIKARWQELAAVCKVLTDKVPISLNQKKCGYSLTFGPVPLNNLSKIEFDKQFAFNSISAYDSNYTSLLKQFISDFVFDNMNPMNLSGNGYHKFKLELIPDGVILGAEDLPQDVINGSIAFKILYKDTVQGQVLEIIYDKIPISIERMPRPVPLSPAVNFVRDANNKLKLTAQIKFVSSSSLMGAPTLNIEDCEKCNTNVNVSELRSILNNASRRTWKPIEGIPNVYQLEFIIDSTSKLFPDIIKDDHADITLSFGILTEDQPMTQLRKAKLSLDIPAQFINRDRTEYTRYSNWDSLIANVPDDTYLPNGVSWKAMKREYTINGVFFRNDFIQAAQALDFAGNDYAGLPQIKTSDLSRTRKSFESVTYTKNSDVDIPFSPFKVFRMNFD